MFTFQKSDGSVVSMDVPNEIIANSADLHQAQASITDFMTEKGVCKMFFGSPDQVVAKVERDFIRQALTGATDLLLYGKYDHPITAPGLHIMSKADFNSPLSEDVGVVRSSYVGDAVPAPALLNGQNVWHKVGIELGDVYTSALKGKYAEVRAKKHNFIEQILRGYALDVWVAPIRDYAATIAVQWLVNDLARASEFKSQRMTANRVRQNVIKPAGYKAWKHTEANNQAGADTVLPDEIWIENMSGVAMDLMLLNSETTVQLYLGGIPVQKMTFIPGNATRILSFVEVLKDEPNFVAELIG